MNTAILRQRNNSQNALPKCCPHCDAHPGPLAREVRSGNYPALRLCSCLYQVVCPSCGLSGPARPYPWEAIFWWNNMFVNRDPLRDWELLEVAEV